MISAVAPTSSWQPLPRLQPLSLWLPATLVACAELALTVAWNEGWIASLPAAALHIGMVAFVWVLLAKHYAAGKDIRLAALHCCLLLAAGPLGAALNLVTLITLSGMKPPPSREAWFESIGESETIDPILYTEERIAFGLDDTSEQDGLIPYGEILAFGTNFEKQKVLGSITRYFRPEFAPLLKSALADKDNGVRVMAATAMAAIEGRYVKEIMVRKTALLQNSLTDDNLYYASACVVYAQSGLLDKAASQDYLDKALYTLEGIDLSQSGFKLPVEQLATLYLHGGLPLLAKETLEAQLYGPEPSPEAARLYMQALFELGEHELLRRVQPRFVTKPLESLT